MLFFVKNKYAIEFAINEWNNTNSKLESLVISREAAKRGDVYWTCMDFICYDTERIKIVSIPSGKEIIVEVNELHNFAKGILFKNIGSVEAQIYKIRKSLKVLNSYKGKIINSPKAIDYGMEKYYLLELQKNNFPVISTKIYDRNICKEDILQNISTNVKYIIKPVTGELSNSFRLLEDIDNKWLRYKEKLVGGWIVQPFIEHIWDGEFQLRFIGDKHISTFKKICKKGGHAIPNQKEREWIEIEACNDSLILSHKLRMFVENDLKIGKIDYYRFDFIKTPEGFKVLEFEFVNPGLGYDMVSYERCKKFSNLILDLIYYNK